MLRRMFYRIIINSKPYKCLQDGNKILSKQNSELQAKLNEAENKLEEAKAAAKLASDITKIEQQRKIDTAAQLDEITKVFMCSLAANHVGVVNEYGTMNVTFTPEELKRVPEKYDLIFRRNYPYMSVTYYLSPKDWHQTKEEVENYGKTH